MTRRIASVVIIAIFCLLAAGTSSPENSSSSSTATAQPAPSNPAPMPVPQIPPPVVSPPAPAPTEPPVQAQPLPPAQPPAVPVAPMEEPPAPSPPSFWDDPALVRVTNRSDCPHLVPALVKGYNPGTDEFDRREAEKQRKLLVPEALKKVYVTGLSGQIGEYNFGRDRFPIEIDGIVECRGPATPYTKKRSIGGRKIAITFGRAKIHKAKVVRATVHEWDARPVKIYLPIPEVEAQQFRATNPNVTVELAFRLRKGRIDRRMSEGLFGIQHDFGAGPLIDAKVIGHRIFGSGGVLADTAPAKSSR